MISDVLFTAVSEIDRYRRDFACYGEPDLAAWIDRVRQEMDALRAHLDTPPTEKQAADHAERRKEGSL